MAGGVQAKGGKKNRKFGRNKDSDAMARYRAEDRGQINKKRRIAREEAKQAKIAAAKEKAAGEQNE